MADSLLIWGASGHARVVAQIARLQNYKVAGFLDDLNPDRYSTEFAGATILGGREQLDILLQQGVKLLVIGIGDCSVRLKLADYAQQKGFTLATLVHTSAVIAEDVVLGAGTVVAAQAVINSASAIGDNVILNTSSSVDHDCHLENGVHVSPGVHLAGGVEIGYGTWLGIGTVVKDKVKIGRQTIIGAGSVVLDDLPDQVLAYGVPAKIIRKIDRLNN